VLHPLVEERLQLWVKWDVAVVVKLADGDAQPVTRRAGLPLVIAGIIQDQQYYDEVVAPSIDGVWVRYLGAVGPELRPDVLGGAIALLHLNGFEEPFGYSVIEAMACGTPVVAYRRGFMPELVEDRVTGFLVRDAEQAVEAVAWVGPLDRARVRQHSVAHFGLDRMTDEYLAAYETLVNGAVDASSDEAQDRDGMFGCVAHSQTVVQNTRRDPLAQRTDDQPNVGLPELADPLWVSADCDAHRSPRRAASFRPPRVARGWLPEGAPDGVLDGRSDVRLYRGDVGSENQHPRLDWLTVTHCRACSSS
jgi:hypothetical protein